MLIDMKECTNTKRQVTGGSVHEGKTIDNTANGRRRGPCIQRHITENITVAKNSHQYVHLYVCIYWQGKYHNRVNVYICRCALRNPYVQM